MAEAHLNRNDGLQNMEKLDKQNIETILALTPMQEGLLFHYLKEPQSDLYLEQLCLAIAGEIELKHFEKAWNFVIESNEMLRTVFRWEKIENPIQIILKEHCLQPGFHDFTGKSKEEIEKSVEEVKAGEREKVVDLHGKVPFRVSLCKIAKDKYEMVISNHHILYDGWSNGIILKEFFNAYADLAAVKEPLKPVKSKFEEFVKWRQNCDKGKQEKYWRNYLRGFDTQTAISLKRRRLEPANSRTLKTSFTRDMKTELELFVNTHKITLASLLYCAWGILLQKYNNNRDVLFGITVSGRSARVRGVEGIVGLFINTLPLRVQCDPGEKIEELLYKIDNTLRQREENDASSASLVDIKGYSELAHNEEFFDSIIVIENYPLDNRFIRDNGRLSVDSYSLWEKTHYDLTVGITIFEEIEMSFNYNEGVYDNGAMANMSLHFKKVIRDLVDEPGIKISEIEIITGEEKSSILYDFNNTGAEYPKDKTIHQLFAEQALRTPDRIAIFGESVGPVGHVGHVSLSYRQLNEQSNRLAGLLIEKGVLADTIVGIMMERCVEMIIGILGILKSGGAYLPIDPEYPQERIDYMLKDSNAKIIVGNRHASSEIHHSSFIIHHSSHLAYIIYTSGTTGRPRGVMVEHRNVVNTVTWFAGQYNIGEGVRVLQTTDYTFDPSVEQIFGALLHGGALYLADKELLADIDRLRRFIDRNRVHIINSVPIMLKELLDNGPKLESVRAVLSGGDKLEETVKDIILEKGYELYNHYGPTEVTVDALSAKCSPGPVVLGKPIANVACYIQGVHGEFMPVGVAGELTIGGNGVARGYLNRVELTAEKFKFNRSYKSYRTYIFYKTGDLARWLSDGNIEFLGRLDYQVKVRGFRIELSEIETRLAEQPLIKETVVIARDAQNEEKYLCAYFTARGTVDAAELKEFLSRALPNYMIPAHFVRLSKIPLTSNGKVDRKALPLPGPLESKTYKAPRNEIERKLTGLWPEILGKTQNSIGIDDNFFQLGGHSLSAARLVSRIHKNLNVVVPVAQLFKFPTIRELAGYMNRANREIYASIKAVEKKDYYIATPAQKRLYILHQVDEDNTGYNMTQVLQLDGEIDSARLRKTFHRLIERHESSRTSFGMIDGQVVQRIHDNVETKVFAELFSKSDPPEAIIKSFIRPFDLSQAPLLRVGLLKESEQRHILMVDMHHIIADGISTGILIKDFMALWTGEELPPLPIQYKDFSQWQGGPWWRDAVTGQQTYWIEQFSGDIPALDLPIDFTRPLVQRFEGKRLTFEIGKKETAALQTLAFRQGATLYMVLAALASIFLAKLSNREDIVMGTPTAGRRHPDLENIIGMFVNTLALRYYPTGEKTFVTYLGDVKEDTLEAFENQDYPFEELIETLSIPRDTGRNPLFDVMFALQGPDIPALRMPGLIVTPLEYDPGTAKFDLTFTCKKFAGNLVFSVEYATSLFKEGTIERFIGYFKKIVSDVVDEPVIIISEIELMSEEEKKEILIEFNNTGAEGEYPRDKKIQQLFAGQVTRTPDYIAIVGAVPRVCPVSLSYSKLNEQSGRLAGLLIEKGVLPDSIVAIMMERSVELIIGILGILKSAGAYLPINPGNPPERIDYMLKDSNAKIIVGNRHACSEIHHSSFIVHHSSHLAYIIYTSGSTGNPKGVPVAHANISPLLHWGYKRLGIGPGDRVIQNLAYYFDWSVWEIFITLTTGGGLYMVPDELPLNPAACIDFMNRNGITVLHVTPTQYSYFVNTARKLETLRYLFIGAEKLTHDLARRSFASVNAGCRVFNMYGPTECTIISAVLEIRRADVENNRFEHLTGIPIGSPVGNTSLLVLDRYLNLCPINVTGELYIAGDCVAIGYLNNPELSAEKFNRSYRSYKTYINYKTGDLARWLPDGNIEFLGRIDNQVKIRGFRIELGEIESRLAAHSGIKEAIVVSQEDGSGDKYLCAYIVSHKELPASELREYLSQELPGYMMPSRFIFLDRIPLTPNGKVDRNALPAPGINAKGDYIAPGNEVERKLVRIWADILGIDASIIGVDSDFFTLGGHSLKATDMISRIHKELYAKVPLAAVFKKPVVRELAAYINGLARDEYTPIEPAEKKEYYAVSSAQSRLFVLQQMDIESTAYNMPLFIETIETPDKESFAETFYKLIERHETLRTSFSLVGQKSVQVIRAPMKVNLEYYERGVVSDEDIMKRFIRPFELAKAPLMRIGIAAANNMKWALMIDMHHIISDRISHGILAEEFFALYNGRELPPLKLQYKDYSEWQESPRQKKALEKQEEYWLRQFKDGIPILNMPLDFQRPDELIFEGDSLAFEINSIQTAGIKSFISEKGATLNIFLLAVYNVLLSKYTGQEDILVGIVIAGRRHTDLQNIIGFFVNMLPMRNHPLGNKTFDEFLRDVKENAVSGYENQEYPFEKLVSKLEIKRQSGRHPLIDTVFVFQEREEKKPGIQIPRQENLIRNPYKISHFDLMFHTAEASESIGVTIEYSSSLFKKSTIDEFSKCYIDILEQVVANKEIPLAEIEISHNFATMDFGALSKEKLDFDFGGNI